MPFHDPIIILLIFLATVGSSLLSRSMATGSEARLARLEAKINQLLDKLGVEHDTPGDEVRDYLARGMKIEAIKVYREHNSGMTLKEAKDAVDAMEADMKAATTR